jgi:hypothetical protein
MMLTTTVEGPELDRRPEQHQREGGRWWLLLLLFSSLQRTCRELLLSSIADITGCGKYTFDGLLRSDSIFVIDRKRDH